MINTYIFEYLDENDFRKKERSVRKYNMLAYKKLTFNYYPELRKGNFLGKEVSKNEKDNTISYESWPTYDESKTIDDEIELPVQVNGKLKTTVMISLDEDESSIKAKVHSALEGKLDGKSIVKEIYVKNKIYNVVVK